MCASISQYVNNILKRPPIHTYVHNYFCLSYKQCQKPANNVHKTCNTSTEQKYDHDTRTFLLHMSQTCTPHINDTCATPHVHCTGPCHNKPTWCTRLQSNHATASFAWDVCDKHGQSSTTHSFNDFKIPSSTTATSSRRSSLPRSITPTSPTQMGTSSAGYGAYLKPRATC
jgi:hypothetical protein